VVQEEEAFVFFFGPNNQGQFLLYMELHLWFHLNSREAPAVKIMRMQNVSEPGHSLGNIISNKQLSIPILSFERNSIVIKFLVTKIHTDSHIFPFMLFCPSSS
jgi:hypothetical protein